MAKYLNGTGLARAWEKIKAYVDGVFEDIPEATTTSAGLMSATDKTILYKHGELLQAHDDKDTYISTVQGHEATADTVSLKVLQTKFTDTDDSWTATYKIPAASTSQAGTMSSSDKSRLDNLVSTIGATASSGSVYANDVAYIAATDTEYGGMTIRNIPTVYTCSTTAAPGGSAQYPSTYAINGSSYTGSTSQASIASAVGTLYIDESNRRLVNLCDSKAYYGSTAAKIYTVVRPGDIIYHDSHPWLAINEKGDLAEFPTAGASV